MNEKHILKTENIVPNKVAKSLLELRFEEKLKEHHGNNKKELLEQGLIPKDEIDNIKDEIQTTLSIKKHKDFIELRYDFDNLRLYKTKVIIDINPPCSIFVNQDKAIKKRLEKCKRELSKCKVVFK